MLHERHSEGEPVGDLDVTRYWICNQTTNMIIHHEFNSCPCCTAVTITSHWGHNQVLHVLPQPGGSF